MKKKKPKILYVMDVMPCPAEMGVHQRILNIGLQMKKFGEVTFAYIGQACANSRIISTENELGPIYVFPADEKRMPGIPANLMHKILFHWPWYCPVISAEDRKKFNRLYEQNDIIWFHTLRAADAAGRYTYKNSVLDLDDLNQVKFRLRMEVEKGIRKKIANAILLYKWSRRENKAFERFSRLAVCSEEDRKILSSPGKTAVIPNGYELPGSEPQWCEGRKSHLGFMGYLGYAPNREGLEWFGREVLPLIVKKVPDFKLRVMGHVPEPDRFSRYKEFELLGFVPDAAAEMSRWNGMIVPLQFGGGTRLKILDAFSKKCPVISTRIGAHGIEATDGKEILLADNAENFAKACIQILENPSIGKPIAEKAWTLFREKYTWDIIGERIGEIINGLVKEQAVEK